MRKLLGAVLLLSLLGCGRAQPALSGGKPVKHWVEILKSSPDARARKEAAFKLGNVGPADPTAFPTLFDALKDRDAAVRCEAVLALLKCGPAAREAVPALAKIHQQDQDPRVRDYAAKAVEKLQTGK